MFKWVLPLIVLVTLAGPSPASAHEERAPSNVQPALTKIPAELNGLHIELLHTLAPQLVIQNPTGEPLEIEDESGNPALRIGPKDVEANLAASAAFRSPQPVHEPRGPARSGGAGKPQWVKVNNEPSWGWFDPRLRFDSSSLPEKVTHGARSATVGEWRISTRFGGRTLELRGEFRFVPPPRGYFESRLVSPSELAPHLMVEVAPGMVPGLYLQNDTNEVVTVIGRDGEPFLKIGPGDIYANQQSPSWKESGRAPVEDQPGPPAKLAGAPDWRRVSGGSRYSWLELRARYPEPEPPPRILRRGTRTTVKVWQVPLILGGRRLSIKGATDWVPVPRPLGSAARNGGASRSP